MIIKTEIDGDYLETNSIKIGLLYLDEVIDYFDDLTEKWMSGTLSDVHSLGFTFIEGDTVHERFPEKIRLTREQVDNKLKLESIAYYAWVGAMSDDSLPEYRATTGTRAKVPVNAFTNNKTVGYLRRLLGWIKEDLNEDSNNS